MEAEKYLPHDRKETLNNPLRPWRKPCALCQLHYFTQGMERGAKDAKRLQLLLPVTTSPHHLSVVPILLAPLHADRGAESSMGRVDNGVR